MTHHYNARIPTSALVNLAHPDRGPVCPTPVFAFEDGACYFPVLCGSEAPILVTHDDIVELGGTVPEGGDILVGVPGRKVWLGATCYEMTQDRRFVEC